MKFSSSSAVLIVGGRGEFGQFLQRDILPSIGANSVLTIERDTPPEQQLACLRQARHIVLATPLADYVEQACQITHHYRELSRPATLWLISSVQAGVWRAVSEALATQGNLYLAAVFVHPMYGPNGFRASEQEAQTFRNILTATLAGAQHSLADEVAQIGEAFRSRLGIETTAAFDPEEHDRITAYSQGLSYCVAEVMFEQPEIDLRLRERMPDLHYSFHANHDLIVDFLRINAYIPEVTKVFTDAWRRTSQSSHRDVLNAFAIADETLNGGGISPIPTKWYQKLRACTAHL
jgi:prephenate dehydrogenase